MGHRHMIAVSVWEELQHNCFDTSEKRKSVEFLTSAKYIQLPGIFVKVQTALFSQEGTFYSPQRSNSSDTAKRLLVQQ